MPTDFSTALVLRVNEVYHDVEGERYQQVHPEIFEDEADQWRTVAKGSIARHDPNRPVVLLDIGTGSGFVPLQFRDVLKGSDTVIAADLSGRMLQLCRKNLESANLQAAREYVKLDGKHISVADARCSIVTMNSVLHHIPDIAPFLAEVDRVLAPGGRLVVGHEPNRRFYRSRLLRTNQHLASMLFAPRQFAGSALRALGLLGWVRRAAGRLDRATTSYGSIVTELNDRLMREGAIRAPLSPDEVTAIVDIHSPTAGGFHAERGIDLLALGAAHLPGYVVEQHRTYNHLGDRLSNQNWLTRRYDARLRRMLPGSGATFLSILRKPS